MIEVMKQRVNVLELPPLTEEMMLRKFGQILNVPYDKTAFSIEKAKRVVANCVERGHLSVLEHVNITMWSLTNVATYKDITRHRNCSFTIESTSFVNYETTLPVILSHAPSQDELNLLAYIQDTYSNKGSVKKARDYLPQCTAAKMIMTTNIREWRYIIELRGDPNDNPLTKDWRDLIYIELNREFPFFFPLCENIPDNAMGMVDRWGAHSMCRLHNQEYYNELQQHK